ncbi:MAG: CoA-transferase, partial [Bacilli bacterium]
MDKIISIEQFKGLLKDGMSIMVGGFMACGTAEPLMDAIVDSRVKDLTIICNDAGLSDMGVGKLINFLQVKKLIASHIGLNPTAQKQMLLGELEVELVPQGTLAERIRSGGAG